MLRIIAFVAATLLLSATTSLGWKVQLTPKADSKIASRALLSTAASFALGNGFVDVGNLFAHHHPSYVARAAESVFVGKYNDPNHPGCLRELTADGKTVTITGSDDVSSSTIWKLTAQEKTPGEMLVDFSPKGGPKDLLGVYSKPDNAIKWPDGNMWTKK
jgi:hypothetical protein